MREAAARLDFERATEIRDIIFELKELNDQFNSFYFDIIYLRIIVFKY